MSCIAAVFNEPVINIDILPLEYDGWIGQRYVQKPLRIVSVTDALL